MNQRARFREDNAHDHPSRDAADHANLEPREMPKHPKSRTTAHGRGAGGRGAGRHLRRSDPG